MNDYIVTATAANGTVRAFAAVTTNLVREAANTHLTFPVATAALGRALTGTAMMSKMLKGDKNTMTVQFTGDGPIGGIITVTDSKANVRGYVHNPQIDLPLNAEGKLDVGRAVGNGRLNVIKDLGLKDPYIGFVRISSGEIAEDLAAYFAYSEQVPTVVALGVLVGEDGDVINSGGYIIQLMPDAENTTIDHIEDRISKISSVTEFLSTGKSPEDMLEFILGEKDLKLYDTTECNFKCNCGRDKMEKNLISLGEGDLREIIEEQGEIETQCHFCNKKYVFSKEDIEALISSAKSEGEN